MPTIAPLQHNCGEDVGNTGLTTTGGASDDGSRGGVTNSGAAQRQSQSPRQRESLRKNASATNTNGSSSSGQKRKSSSSSSSSSNNTGGSKKKHSKKPRKKAPTKAPTNEVLPDDKINTIIELLEKCAGTEDIWILEHARSLLKSGTTNPTNSVTVKFLSLLGNDDLSAEEFETVVAYLKKELHLTFSPEFWDRINMGDCLSKLTVLLIIKNYAPWSCVGKEGLRGLYNLISRSNACIAQYCKVLPRSLNKEADGKDWDDALADSVGECISFIDLHLFVPIEKETYKSEFKEFAQKHGVSVNDLKLITFAFFALHVKHHQIVHGGSKKLTVAPASVPANDDFFGGNRDGHENDVVSNKGLLFHGEVVATRRLARYDGERIAEFSRRLQEVFTAVAEVVPDFNVLPLDQQSEIAERFSGRKGMSDEEIEAWLESILEACRKGGRASAQLLQEAASLVQQLVDDEVCESYQEALDLIEFFLSKSHRDRWEGSQMGKEATKFVKEQREQKKCMSDEEAIEAIKKKFGKKGQSYANAWEGTHMASAATKFVEEQREQKKCMSDEEAIEAIKKKFGKKGKSYAAAWKGIQISQMVKVVTELVNEQVKNGNCMTPEAAMDWIKSNFGDKGESYAAAWEGVNMASIATEFVEEQREQNKCITDKDAFDLIKSNFGNKGESYANKWAAPRQLSIAVDFVEEQWRHGKERITVEAFMIEFGDKGKSFAAAFERGNPGILHSPNHYAPPEYHQRYYQKHKEGKKEYNRQYRKSDRGREARKRSNENAKKKKALAKDGKAVAVYKNAKAVYDKYAKLVDNGKPTYLSHPEMTVLLNYIVPKFPKDENDTPSSYTANGVIKMRQRLGISLFDKNDCLSEYFNPL